MLSKLSRAINHWPVWSLINETCCHRKGSANLGSQSSHMRKALPAPLGLPACRNPPQPASISPPQASCKLLHSEFAVLALSLQGKMVKSRTLRKTKTPYLEQGACTVTNQLRSSTTSVSHSQFWQPETDA